MEVVATILMTLSGYVAVGNLYGGLSALWRHRYRNDSRGYSCVPVISLVFGILAYLTGRRYLGLWAFLPSALDPGTWLTAWLPVVLFREFRRNK